MKSSFSNDNLLSSETNDKNNESLIQKIICKNNSNIKKSTQADILLTQKYKDEYLIDRMLSGDKKARDKLIENNTRLVHYMCKKYHSSMEQEELFSIGLIGLIKGVDNFKKEKGVQLSTFLCRCIENEILMSLRANKNKITCISFDDIIFTDKNGEGRTLKDILIEDSELEPPVITENKVMYEEIIKYMKKYLSERQFEIISLRYGFKTGEKLTQQEVADKLKTNKCFVSRVESKAIKLIRDKFLLSKDNNEQSIE